MTIVGENNTDIMLDPNGQPVADSSGDFKIVSGDCFTKMKMEMELMDLGFWISAMRKMMSLHRRK